MPASFKIELVAVRTTMKLTLRYKKNWGKCFVK